MADFSDLDPKTDGWSGLKNMLISYWTLIDVPFLRKLAYNTSYNYNQQQEVILDNELFPRRTSKTFDAGRSWANAYTMMILTIDFQEPVPLPHDIQPGTEPAYIYGIEFTQMTSEYQTLFAGFHYKYLSTGGISLFNNISNADCRVTGSIIKLRRVLGTEVTS